MVEVNPVYLDSVPDDVQVDFRLYQFVNHTRWYRQVVGFNAAVGNPNVLQGWAVGEWALIIERLPDYEVQSVLGQGAFKHLVHRGKHLSDNHLALR